MARLVANLINYPIESAFAVSSAHNTPGQKVQGCKTISVVVTITAASSPTGASVKLQKSNDNVIWFDITTPASQNITANGSLIFDGITDPGYLYIRAAFAISSGSFTATTAITAQSITN